MSTEALKLVDRLIKLSGDPTFIRHAKRMKVRLLLLPMSEVLKQVPGDSLAAKARLIGVSKEACYGWNKGKWRPNMSQSKRLAKITGYAVDVIRGRASPSA